MVVVLFAFELLRDYVLLLLWLAGRQDWRQKLLVSFASAPLSVPITEHIGFDQVSGMFASRLLTAGVHAIHLCQHQCMNISLRSST